MKFFTRRKSNLLKKAAFGSALFVVSAFAAFTPQAKAGEVAEDKVKDNNDFTARYVFEKLHSSALEILPVSIRLDMLDYWDIDSVYKASNVMEGLSWLEKVSPDYLKVRITPVSTLEIRILPAKKGDLAMTIYTVGDDVQAQDSQINFYDSDLLLLNTDDYLVMPRIKDFFDIPKGSMTKMSEIESMIPFPTIAFTANSENTNIEARLTVEQYVNQDDWNIAKLFVKPYIILDWKKDKYRVEK